MTLLSWCSALANKSCSGAKEMCEPASTRTTRSHIRDCQLDIYKLYYWAEITFALFIRGSQLLIHGGPKEVQKYMLEGQMNTTFWAFPIYFHAFQRLIKGPSYTGWQAKSIGGLDLVRGGVANFRAKGDVPLWWVACLKEIFKHGSRFFFFFFFFFKPFWLSPNFRVFPWWKPPKLQNLWKVGLFFKKNP